MDIYSGRNFSAVRAILKDYLYFIKNLNNILRIKIRFKNSTIRDPLQISFSNINNIYISYNVFIDSKCIFRIMDTCSLYIGESTHIGPYCHISGTKNNIIIGKEVLIAPKVFISTTNHRYDDITKSVIKQGYVSKGDVIVEDGCWIGIGSCILTGVKIGKHSIIGANSIVTMNIPPYSVAVGSPAQVIKKYNFKEKKWLRCSNNNI